VRLLAGQKTAAEQKKTRTLRVKVRYRETLFCFGSTSGAKFIFSQPTCQPAQP
jgi:hypothetical protein